MLEAWKAWGWRIPFVLSAFLLIISLYIRLQMSESPIYTKMKEEGAASKAPLREAFGQWKYAKIALIALFGLTAGQAVVWYSGQFYALTFLQSVVKVDSFTANVFVLCSLVLGTYGFIFFGGLSDKIGRKPIILAGCLIAALTYFPLFAAWFPNGLHTPLWVVIPLAAVLAGALGILLGAVPALIALGWSPLGVMSDFSTIGTPPQ